MRPAPCIALGRLPCTAALPPTEQRRNAGHSKWAKVKRAKGAADQKRGQLFAKIGLEIISAIRHGGSDPSMNLRLAAALNKARANSLPKENLENAIKKATAKGNDGAVTEDVVYEALGGHGVALVIEAVTDNRTRTAMKLRSTLGKFGGQMTPVAYMFEKKGIVRFGRNEAVAADEEAPKPLDVVEVDAMMEVALEAGAEDVEEVAGNLLEATCAVADTQALSRAVADCPSYSIEAVEFRYQPTTLADEPADPDARQSVRRMLDEIEALDDVARVHSNLPATSSLLLSD